jgi:hypothetical protein
MKSIFLLGVKMEYCLAVFRSRSQAFLFKNLLSSYGVNASVISTPRSISVSCGLCVKFLKQYIQTAQDILQRRKFDTFVGFF